MGGDLIWVCILAVISCVAVMRTNTLYWLVCTGWCLFYFWVAHYPPTESGIRELLMALSLLFAFGCTLALFGLRLWNFRTRKKRRLSIYRVCWVLFCLLLILVTLVQNEVLDYLVLLRAEGSFFTRLGYLLLFVAVLFLLWQTGQVFACLLDRVFSRRSVLVLIGCRMSEPPGMVRRYYLQGVHNGITEYFRVNRQTFPQVKRMQEVTLELKTGLLGGRYVTLEPGVASRKQQIAERDKKQQQVKRHFWRRKIRNRREKSHR